MQIGYVDEVREEEFWFISAFLRQNEDPVIQHFRKDQVLSESLHLVALHSDNRVVATSD